MGLFADIKALKDVQRIKAGGKANLSISQITGLITNMSDAQKNLTAEQFENVYNLFKELRKCNTKIEMTIDGYYETAVKIIKKFDFFAPYEKYSGGNEMEFSFLMDEIRSSGSEEIEDFLDLSIYCDPKEAQEDIDNIVNGAMINIRREDAEAILAVCICNKYYGKESALKAFDILANRIIDEVSEIEAITEISYFAGLLYPNGVLGSDESTALGKKYTDPILQKIKNGLT